MESRQIFLICKNSNNQLHYTILIGKLRNLQWKGRVELLHISRIRKLNVICSNDIYIKIHNPYYDISNSNYHLQISFSEKDSNFKTRSRYGRSLTRLRDIEHDPELLLERNHLRNKRVFAKRLSPMRTQFPRSRGKGVVNNLAAIIERDRCVSVRWIRDNRHQPSARSLRALTVNLSCSFTIMQILKYVRCWG